MTDDQFVAASRLLRGTPGRSNKAARMVLVDGLSIMAACREIEVDKAGVSRLCKRIRQLVAGGCPTCGNPI